MVRFPKNPFRSNEAKLLDAIRANNLKKVNRILRSKVNPNALTEQSNGITITLLQVAVDKGYDAIVDALLDDPRTDINAQNADGNTALICAVCTEQTDMVKKLLERGADPNILNQDNMAALHYAVKARNETIAELLLKHKANPDIDKELVRQTRNQNIINLLELYKESPESSYQSVSLEEVPEVMAGTDVIIWSDPDEQPEEPEQPEGKKPALKIVGGLDMQGGPVKGKSRND